MTARGLGPSTGLWPISAMGSMLAHGLFLLALAWSTLQHPLPQQAPPESRVELTDRVVKSQTAEPTEAHGAEVQATDAGGAAVGQAAPAPQSVAARRPADASTKLAAASPVQSPDAALTPTGPVVKAVEQSVPLTEVPPPAVQQAIAQPTAMLAPVVDPAPVQTGVGLRDASTASAAVVPTNTQIASAPTSGTPSPAVEPEGARVTAELAWSGDQSPTDPLSIAAIAAFASTDVGAVAGSGLRDGVEGMLAAIPCARLQTAFDPASGTLELRGHVPEEALRADVLQQLSARIGPDIPVRDRLQILPAPQCGALAGIADIGLPQSAEQELNPRIIGPDTFVRDYRFTNGQRLQLDLQGPDYPSLVYVDYYDAAGQVIHLQPNDVVPLELLSPKQAFAVGREVDGKPALSITISPPFGHEIAVAMAASQRIYEEPRPMIEPADAYLAFMKDRVAALRAADPDFKGEWVYFFISTAAE